MSKPSLRFDPRALWPIASRRRRGCWNCFPPRSTWWLEHKVEGARALQAFQPVLPCSGPTTCLQALERVCTSAVPSAEAQTLLVKVSPLLVAASPLSNLRHPCSVLPLVPLHSAPPSRHALGPFSSGESGCAVPGWRRACCVCGGRLPIHRGPTPPTRGGHRERRAWLGRRGRGQGCGRIRCQAGAALLGPSATGQATFGHTGPGTGPLCLVSWWPLTSLSPLSLLSHSLPPTCSSSLTPPLLPSLLLVFSDSPTLSPSF